MAKITRGLVIAGSVSLYGAGYTVQGVMGYVYANYNAKHEFTHYSIKVNSCLVNPGGGVFINDAGNTLQELDKFLTDFHFPAEYIFACIDADREMKALTQQWKYSPISF